jgi:hypothetical protein
MRFAAGIAALLLCGCATNESVSPADRTPDAPARVAPPAVVSVPADSCKADVARLRAQLAAETAERQRLVRAASRREEELRRQLEAMKSIERGILDRDEGQRTVTR